LLKGDATDGEIVIYNTIMSDDEESDILVEKAAEIDKIGGRRSKSAAESDAETAKSYIEKLFFNPKKYDLGSVGRYKINYKLGLKIDPHITILTLEDIVEIISYMRDLIDGKMGVDDIDHLGNRRVRTVAEQLARSEERRVGKESRSQGSTY